MKHAFLVLTAIASVLQAAPVLRIVGFSEEGDHLAYAVSGEYEGSAFTYCDVFVLDCSGNSAPVEFRNTDQTGAYGPEDFTVRTLDSLRNELEGFGIIDGYSGMELEFPALDNPPGATGISFVTGENGEWPGGGLHSLLIFSSPADPETDYFGMHPLILQMELSRASDCRSSVLLKGSGRIFAGEPVYRVDVLEILIHPEGNMAVFLECTTEGFEIPAERVFPLVFSDIDLR